MYSHHELLDFTVLVQAFLSFCFFLSAISVFGNHYAGFFALFLALLFSVMTGISHYGLSYHPNKILWGAILGSSVVMIFISLESAIFWGSYGNCVPPPLVPPTTPVLLVDTHRSLYGVECHNTSGIKSCCVFSVFLMLSYLIFITLVIRFKNEILGNDSPKKVSFMIYFVFNKTVTIIFIILYC
jgi:hypothetical protein